MSVVQFMKDVKDGRLPTASPAKDDFGFAASYSVPGAAEKLLEMWETFFGDVYALVGCRKYGAREWAEAELTMQPDEYSKLAVAIDAETEAVVERLFDSGQHADAMRWLLSGTRQLSEDYAEVLDKAASFVRKLNEHADGHSAHSIGIFDIDSLDVLKRYHSIIAC